MELLSREYGWTPSQIREQNLQDIEQYLQIIATRNKLHEIESKKLKAKR